MLGEAHRRYTRHVNFREGWSGHLFQARFASYPMDDAHLMVALRYVENNPVAAGLVSNATDWQWSSARSHLAGKLAKGDQLTDIAEMGRHVRNWRVTGSKPAKWVPLERSSPKRSRPGFAPGDRSPIRTRSLPGKANSTVRSRLASPAASLRQSDRNSNTVV